MRLTRLGWASFAFVVLCLFTAASSGNNLVYLLYASVLSAFVLSVIAGWWNLRRLTVSFSPPDQIFRDTDFPLEVTVQNKGFLPVFALSVVSSRGRATAPCIDPHGEVRLKVMENAAHRGLNRWDALRLESDFPFGFLCFSKRLRGPELTAFPRLREIRSRAELSGDISETGVSSYQKGTGDELIGVREKAPGDDSRLVNWKLTARTGKDLVNVYAGVVGSKVTVRLAGAEGDAGEYLIEEAASACRFHIDAGAEVRLITSEVTLDYDKGLLHLEKLLRVLSWHGVGKKARPSGGPPPRSREADLDDSVDIKNIRRLALITTAVVFASLFLVEDMQRWFLYCLWPVLPLALFLQERDGPWLPKRVWDVISFLVMMYVLGVDWWMTGIIVANTHLLAYILVNRIVNPLNAKALRDLLVISFLVFFTSSAQAINVWYVAVFLTYFSLTGLWLSAASGGPLRPFRSWIPMMTGLLLACLGVTAAGFALTPRMPGASQFNPLALMGLSKLNSRSANEGYTEDVRLGFFDQLGKSKNRILRVKPLDDPAAGSGSMLIRGAALDYFDGKRWSKPRGNFAYQMAGRVFHSRRGRAWILSEGDRMYLPGEPPRKGTRNYEFTLVLGGLSTIFTVGSPHLIDGIRDLSYFDDSDSLYSMVPMESGQRYRLYSSTDRIGFSHSIENYEDFIPTRYLQLPPGLDYRVGALAHRITRGLKDDLSRGRAIESYLRKTYRYQNDSSIGRFSIEDFLFKEKKGHCEYFATAAVLMARQVGIPARLGVGFLADDWNEYGQYYDVRQDQAHAWAEVYIKGWGWAALDATPAAPNQIPEAAREFLNRMSRYTDALEQRWYQYILGFDSGSQIRAFEHIRWGISAQSFKQWMIRLLVVTQGLAMLWALWFLMAQYRKRGKVVDGGLFGRVQALLEKAGFKRDSWLTPREFALRTSLDHPTFSPVLNLAELHYAGRYSSRGLSAEEASEAERDFDALSQAVSQVDTRRRPC